jgi:aspartyl/glutamyl-tRNA(Asn/Gln) amidotransferase C subunit
MSKKADFTVDEKMVKDIATLARLDLSREETEMFVSQFKEILDYVSILEEVDRSSHRYRRMSSYPMHRNRKTITLSSRAFTSNSNHGTTRAKRPAGT